MKNNYEFSELDIENIKTSYQSGINITTIARSFNCSFGVIKRKLKSLGILKKNNRRKYDCNHNYFQVIDTPQKAYWLGFFMADGNVSSIKQKTISLCLSVKDKQVITNFLNEIGSNHKIYEYNFKNPVAQIRIDSPQLHADLIKHGCVSKKTKILKYPNIDSKFENSFILGYLDGDGCICDSPKNKQIVFLGTKDMLEHISVALPFIHNVKIVETRGIFRLGIRLNKERASVLYTWLYNNNIFYLSRKKEILERIIQKFNATN